MHINSGALEYHGSPETIAHERQDVNPGGFREGFEKGIVGEPGSALPSAYRLVRHAEGLGELGTDIPELVPALGDGPFDVPRVRLATPLRMY